MAATAIQLTDLLAPAGTPRKPSRRDKDIYLLSRRGMTAEEIAVRYGVKEPTIKAAIERYQIYRDGLSIEEIDLDLNAMASRLIPKAEKVLTGAMGATVSKVFSKGAKSFTRTVPDHAMRLKALETMKGMMETARPKGGGISINTQVNNGQGGGGTIVAKSFDFEARLRAIRERKGLSSGEGSVVDVDYEEEEKDELAKELAEMGIELEEDEDDEDEE